MSNSDDDSTSKTARGITYPFPHSRVAPPRTAGGFRDLGVTPLARQLGLSIEQTNGHWCSRCEGIWFGYTLEAQCPVCGNRKG
ncbi:MAG: hypothetical protein ABSF50_13065 [Burkholderiaceae bacterium]|jgi:hypothetical protein